MGATKINVSLLVDEEDVVSAVTALHREFIESGETPAVDGPPEEE